VPAQSGQGVGQAAACLGAPVLVGWP